MTTLLNTARILRRVLETWGDMLSLILRWKTTSERWYAKLLWMIIIKIIIMIIRQNSKFRLCGDRDETINHIISKCSKLALKEYKTRHDWDAKVVHGDMRRKFPFDHTNRWFMHNLAPVQENDLHKPLWEFIHTNGSPNPGQKTRPHNNQQKKENL